MHVVIVTYGTRGDVQPMAAIALEFLARGHTVVLAVAFPLGAPRQRPCYGGSPHAVGATCRMSTSPFR